MYKLNRIGNRQHPCLVFLPVFTFLISTWSSLSLSLSTMYNLLITFLSRQSMPLSFKSALFCTSLHSKIISANTLSKHRIFYLCLKWVLILFSASQWHPCFLPLFQVQCDLHQVRSQFSSVLFQSMLSAILDTRVITVIVRWQLQFVAFGFFFKLIILIAMKSPGHSLVQYGLLCYQSHTIFPTM